LDLLHPSTGVGGGFWSESWVEIPDELIERHYYGAQYILASCSRNPVSAGPLGQLGYDRHAGLAGDYHLTTITRRVLGIVFFQPPAACRRYDAPLLEYLEQGRRNAKEFLGVRGVYYEVGIGPRGFCSALFRPNEESPGAIRASELDHGHQFWDKKATRSTVRHP